MRASWLLAIGLFLLTAPTAVAQAGPLRVFGPDAVTKLNRKLAGQVHDFTHNHGSDRRVHSPALDQKRDLYSYTPPGYDGHTSFPFMLFLHGLGQDEKIFLDVVEHFDDAIRKGEMPPLVIVCPDGSVGDRPSLIHTGSFFVNSKAGRFGDFIAEDVWDFAHTHYKLRPERDAHVIAGASMGGFGAFNVGFKQRDKYGSIVGIMPPLNLRYGDLEGRYFTEYDPANFALRPVGKRNEIVGEFYGLVFIRSRRILDPLVGRNSTEPTKFVSQENPYEMLASYDVRPGEFNLFIGYGRRDEFNIDAAVESFLDEAKRHQIEVETLVLPEGRHNLATAVSMLPDLNQWLVKHVAPYAPEGYRVAGSPAVGPRQRRYSLPLLRPGLPVRP